jgi:hypothetical protein
MPQELVPQWAAGLVPENLRIDVNLADFNLAAPAAMMIDRFDLAKDPPLPQELDNELLAALLPSGALTIGLGPSEILSTLYHLTAEGSMTAGPVAMPQGKGLVKLKVSTRRWLPCRPRPPKWACSRSHPFSCW